MENLKRIKLHNVAVNDVQADDVLFLNDHDKPLVAALSKLIISITLRTGISRSISHVGKIKATLLFD